MKKSDINNKWFFTDLHPSMKLLLVFIKGDMIVLLPLLGAILLLAFFSIKYMLIMLGCYISLRYLGEMMYWFLHQFGERKYRPADFGLKNLDNNGIYILYQTIATAWIMVGIGIIVAAVMFIK